LVADIDRGGVFATVYGTVKLLDEADQARFKGVIINKFRGDVGLLKPGLKQLEDLTGVPVLGVMPYLRLDIDDEDSVTDRLSTQTTGKPLDIAVIRLPRISNFTDFNALSRLEPVGLRYVDRVEDLKNPDLIILPGTKNTMGDLRWLRQNGLEDAVKARVEAGIPLVGICGGYQMLGRTLSDPDHVEDGGEMAGMGLLPADTVFEPTKVRTRVTAAVSPVSGYYEALSGCPLAGYEIHMGRTTWSGDDVRPFAMLSDGQADGAVHGRVFGTYLHGLFDSGLSRSLAALLLKEKGLDSDIQESDSFEDYKNKQYDLLADALRQNLDMAAIYKALGL
jgi:adenosylcobyric acid synthase